MLVVIILVYIGKSLKEQRICFLYDMFKPRSFNPSPTETLKVNCNGKSHVLFVG